MISRASNDNEKRRPKVYLYSKTNKLVSIHIDEILHSQLCGKGKKAVIKEESTERKGTTDCLKGKYWVTKKK